MLARQSEALKQKSFDIQKVLVEHPAPVYVATMAMKTTALRVYGKKDLRLETFDLPEPQDDEILAEIVTDSVCMSSYKAAVQGEDHRRVPKDVRQRPVIIGHEFAGYITWVGKKWADRFKPGQKFTIQPALGYQGTYAAPGYSFQYVGGMASRVIIPPCVMESDCLLLYEGEGFFKASLSEPFSCVIGACRAQYHHAKLGSYEHKMGIREGGNCALLGGAGPMGMACVDYLLNGPMRPKLLVVTDIDRARLDWLRRIFSAARAARRGIVLRYLDVSDTDANQVELIRAESGGEGFDDVFVFVPAVSVIEAADALLREDGCLNFFAGPSSPCFAAKLNFYSVHYSQTHVVGTSGGNADDMLEALELIGRNALQPAAMVTHIGGITCGRDVILSLPSIPGGKKLIYTQYDLPLVAIQDFRKMAAGGGGFYAMLAEICERHEGMWSVDAEEFLLKEGPRVKND